MAQMKWFLCVLLLTASTVVLAVEESNDAERMSDDEVAQLLIRQSINRYSGNCPCPYNRASNGSRCGKRSAYSRPGGATPLCYKNDVTEDMIERWRSSTK